MKKIYFLAALALMLTACDSNEDTTSPVTSSQVPARVFATIGESVPSRAGDTDWTAGDQIGITITVGDDTDPNNNIATPYTNVLYTTDGGSEFKGQPLYFYWPMLVTAYYPYAGTKSTAPGIISAVTDAVNQTAVTHQPKIDFLFATGKTSLDSNGDPQVDFTFAHKMSKLIFAFKGSDEVIVDGYTIPGVKVSDMVSYEIEGLVLDGTFDTATGVCAVKDGTEADNIKINLTKGTVEDEKSLPPLIVFPQKPGNNSVILHVYTDELNNSEHLQHYTCTLTFGDGELKPGNSYKYTIQITNRGLILGGMTIDDWNKEREVNLTATVDGGWKPGEQQ